MNKLAIRIYMQHEKQIDYMIESDCDLVTLGQMVKESFTEW